MKRALMQFGNPFGLALYDKSRANVAVPRESKANSRGLYSALQAAMRQQETDADLRRWWKANARDIATLPEDWQGELAEEGADMTERFQRAEA
jgi:hypothetical protein